MRHAPRNLLLLLLLLCAAPTASSAQTFADSCYTAAERVRLADSLAVVPVLREGYREQGAATADCNLRLLNKEEQLRNQTALTTVAQSKATRRGVENWLLKGLGLALLVFAITR